MRIAAPPPPSPAPSPERRASTRPSPPEAPDEKEGGEMWRSRSKEAAMSDRSDQHLEDQGVGVQQRGQSRVGGLVVTRHHQRVADQLVGGRRRSHLHGGNGRTDGWG
ncbi:hypothetical protein Vretifemale_13491 [Volvox reticuliferus]|uniref:Uncharacterized protein n=1 Tax=Volvox reticuliferus TaxID=1737510 RepID=A0A8J4FT51_9CHLO|nr:hypothetical protein Vretifemale_13491 [Volvox reticuliferus]